MNQTVVTVRRVLRGPMAQMALAETPNGQPNVARPARIASDDLLVRRVGRLLSPSKTYVDPRDYLVRTVSAVLPSHPETLATSERIRLIWPRLRLRAAQLRQEQPGMILVSLLAGLCLLLP